MEGNVCTGQDVLICVLCLTSALLLDQIERPEPAYQCSARFIYNSHPQNNSHNIETFSSVCGWQILK